MAEVLDETIEELMRQDIDAVLHDVVITRMRTAPWTLSYVRYSDGTLGLGIANNEAKVPDDVGFVKDLLNLDVYDVISKLESLGKGVFINSLKASIASALSYRLMNPNALKRAGYNAEVYEPPNLPLLNPSKFVRGSDVVAMIGFHPIATPLCAEVAREVRVTELMDLRELTVIDFSIKESNLKIFPASEARKALEGADVVYITGETIVNETIDELLELSKDARVRIVYGPTSSFYPKALFERGVDVSLPVIFPNTPEFRRRFTLSRGYWYSMRDIKQLLIQRKGMGET